MYIVYFRIPNLRAKIYSCFFILWGGGGAWGFRPGETEGEGRKKREGRERKKEKKEESRVKRGGGDKRKEDTIMFYCERRRGREKFISIVKMGTAR